MVKTPVILLRTELVLSALAVISGLGLAVVALQHEFYFMLASELLIVVAGVFGVIAGLGRFAQGPALAAACVAGCVITGAGVGGLESTVLPSFRSESTVLTASVLSRVGIAVLLGGVAGLMIVSRTPGRSTKYLVTGGLIGSPVLALGAAWRLGLIARLQDGVPEIVFQIGALVVGMAMIVLVSISAHCVIRAFEVGVDAADAASGKSAA